MEEPTGEPEDVRPDTVMSLEEAGRSVQAFFGPIEDLFKQSGMSQYQLARQAKVSRTTIGNYVSWKHAGQPAHLIAVLNTLYGRELDDHERAEWLARREAARRGNRVLNRHPEIRDEVRAGHPVVPDDDEADLWVPEWWLKEYGPRYRPLGRRVRRLLWRVVCAVSLVGLVLVVLPDVGRVVNGRTGIAGLVIAAMIAAAFVVRRRRQHSRQSDPARYRTAMLRRVEQIWVDGYLSTLADLPRLTPMFHLRPTAVAQPGSRHRRRIPAGQSVAAGTTIVQLFDDVASGLLLISDGGHGKTTQLAELARALTAQATDDPSHRIPVIISLSSWRGQTFDDWLVDQLWLDYDVPKSIAREWVQQNLLLPLMDGLDEVPATYQAELIRALERWRRDHGLDKYVVTARTQEYRRLVIEAKRPAPFDTAISIAAPTRGQVLEFLDADAALHGLKESATDDTTVLDFLRSPLVLALAARTYKAGGQQAFLEPAGHKRRLQLLIDEYVTAMLTEHRPHLKRIFSPEWSMRWLWWLARGLLQRQRTVFHLDRLGADWVNGSRYARWAPLTIVGLCGVAAAATLTLIPSFHISERPAHLDIFIAWTLVAELIYVTSKRPMWTPVADEYPPVERIRLSRSFPLLVPLQSRLKPGERMTVLGLARIAPEAITIMMFAWVSVWMGFTSVGDLEVTGFAVPILLGLFTLASDQFEVELDERRWHINEGIRRSARYSIRAFVVSFIIVTGGAWLLMHLLLTSNLRSHLAVIAFATLAGLFAAVTNGFRFGGAAIISHYTIRLLLWSAERAPLRFERFLEESSSRLLLRRVGNGYRFVHREVLEWFASQPKPKTPPIVISFSMAFLLLEAATGFAYAGIVYLVVTQRVEFNWVWLVIGLAVQLPATLLMKIRDWTKLDPGGPDSKDSK